MNKTGFCRFARLVRSGSTAHYRFGRKLVSGLFAVSTLFAAALTGSPARADLLNGKGDEFLSRSVRQSSTGSVNVIVRLHGELTAPHEKALHRLGVDIYRNLPVIQSIAARVPIRNMARLAGLGFVKRLSSDMTVSKSDEFTVKSSGADVAYAKYDLTGEGVGVAVVDSGISKHEDLTKPGLLGTVILSQNRIVKSVNFVASEPTTEDLCGHGTHVAGIIGGNGHASTGLLAKRSFYGIARKVNLVSVRVLNRVGQSDVSTVIAGIQWVINNRSAYKIKVLNLSLGHPAGESYVTDPLCQAVERAWNAGIVVVCAAGNDGRVNAAQWPGDTNEGWGTAYGSISSPGNDPYVITVGATKSMDGIREHDRIATYSSRGPSRLDLVLKPDIVAPGNHIISTLADGSYLDTAHSDTNLISATVYLLTGVLFGNSNRYFQLSGTSMAAPVVAGGAALMLQKYPNLSPDTIKARMMMSADKREDPSGATDPCTYGAGYLNIPSALNSTVVATQDAMSSSLSEDANGNVYINIDRALWGSRAIWGTGITDLRAVWGTQAIWGNSNLLNASRAIWGTTVWNDRAIWGTTSSSVDLSNHAIGGE